MSEKNGDKSRFQINRKRALARRAAARPAPPAGDTAAPKRFAKAKTTPPKSA
jgi:hypothetical protein